MIGLLNYGLGNIKAFGNIFEKLDLPWGIISDPSEVASASHLVLPGVGAFDEAMDLFNLSGLRTCVETRVAEGVPILGICVGMQMMANSSDEGKRPGLGWIEGHVSKIDNIGKENAYPLPHMGWNTTRLQSSSEPYVSLLDNKEFYFLHSYYFVPADRNVIVAETQYTNLIPAVIRKENIFGMQCHPEKSHDAGVNFLNFFARIN